MNAPGMCLEIFQPVHDRFLISAVRSQEQERYNTARIAIARCSIYSMAQSRMAAYAR